MTANRIQTLDDLLNVLRNAPAADNTSAQTDYGEKLGLPKAHGEIDTTSLPTFGGDEPRDTQGVWSWDATRLLVGEMPDGLKIVGRADIE